MPTIPESCRKKKAAQKPKKPYKNFPLSPHASGAWQKKIRGRTYYFGRWGRIVNGSMQRVPGDGWQEALALYKAQADDLHAGRVPRPTKPDELTIAELCNTFLTAKLRKVQAGDLTSQMLSDYRSVCDSMVEVFGGSTAVQNLTEQNFEALRSVFAEQYGPTRLGNSVQRVRTVCKYAYDTGMIDHPVRFGPEFKRPPARVLRKLRNESAKRLFSAEEIRQLLEGKVADDETIRPASTSLRAMILLGVNAGYGNSDVAKLPLEAIDLENAFIDFPRPKTEIARRCPLWPETLEAIKAVLDERSKPKDSAHADLLFLTCFGNPWVNGSTNSVGLEFGKRQKALGINGRKGLGFYTLRHTFRTVADATKDFPAIRLIMGHADGSIDAVYREHIDDDRLIAVCDHVRGWLFGADEGGAQ